MRILLPARRELGPGRAGTAAIEFAIVAPVLLLCVLGLMEFGRAMWTRAALSYAVQSAARCAQTNAALCGTAAQIQSFAATAAPGLAVSAASFTVTTPACGVQVSVTYPFRFAVPWISVGALSLSAAACYPS
jgi:Flp pilus assembly protein TadG